MTLINILFGRTTQAHTRAIRVHVKTFYALFKKDCIQSTPKLLAPFRKTNKSKKRVTYYALYYGDTVLYLYMGKVVFEHKMFSQAVHFEMIGTPNHFK